MNRREIDPDEAIDRIFDALRDVEPSPGMKRRILNGARERKKTRPVWSLPAGAPWMLATASITIVAVAVLWITLNYRADHKNVASSVHQSPLTAGTQQVPAPAVRSAGEAPPRRSVRIMPKQNPDAAESINTEDSLALSEMNAPSQPAPPMPLTSQEKLLVRLVHKGDPIELAMLDPQFRSLEQANSKAEFDRFFTLPPVPETRPKNPAEPATKESARELQPKSER